MTLKFSPFRRAVPQDPHYKRLASKEKHRFWNIFNNYKTSVTFKDLFEKLTSFNPATRLSLPQILQHQFVLHKHEMPSVAIKKEILNAYENV